MPRELIAGYCAEIKFFRSLLVDEKDRARPLWRGPRPINDGDPGACADRGRMLLFVSSALDPGGCEDRRRLVERLRRRPVPDVALSGCDDVQYRPQTAFDGAVHITLPAQAGVFSCEDTTTVRLRQPLTERGIIGCRKGRIP